MKNRNKHLIAYVVLIAVPLLADIISLFFLPEIIPLHYSLSGEADRFGSKFEILILPVCFAVIGAVIFPVAGLSSKNETSTKSNEKTVLIVGECCLAMFLIINFYTLYISAKGVTNIYDPDIDITSVAFIPLGILLMISGNIMPKTKRNSIVGVRLPWTQKNDEVWKKSQHFGGIVSIVCGFLVLLSSFIFKGADAIAAVIISITIMTIIITVYSYLIYKKTDKQ